MLEVLGASRIRLLEEPLAGLASLLSRLGSGSDLFLGEAIELCLIFDEYCGSLRASVHLLMKRVWRTEISVLRFLSFSLFSGESKAPSWTKF